MNDYTPEEGTVTAVMDDLDRDTHAAIQAAARLQATADTANECTRIIKADIPIRDAAMLSLLYDHGLEPIGCYRPARLNRNTFHKKATRALEEEKPGVPRTIARRRYDTKEEALAVAAEAGARIQEARARGREARKERNALLLRMLYGEIRKPDGETYSDAELMRVLGVASSRIAQIKSGRR